MKKSYWIVGGLFILESSCIIEYETATKFVIQNESSVQVKIFISHFLKDYHTLDTTFVLDPDSQIDHIYYLDGKNAVYPHPFGPGSDSAQLIFDDRLSTTYTLYDSVPRNILHFENYNGGELDKSIFEFYYIIKESDYQNASEFR